MNIAKKKVLLGDQWGANSPNSKLQKSPTGAR